MGPHAALADHTVRENIMTGLHFLGSKLQVLWHLRQAQPNSERDPRLLVLQERAEILRLNRLSRQSLCGYFCEGQEQAHGRTGLAEPHLVAKSGL